MEWTKEWKLNQLIKLSEGKMAESKGALLAKSVQKHAVRAKEKVRLVDNSIKLPTIQLRVQI
jgi:hypothetical protein